MDWLESLSTILSPTLISLIVTTGIGLIIGLEREFNTQDQPTHVGGIRTFVLTAILGNIADLEAKNTLASSLVSYY